MNKYYIRKNLYKIEGLHLLVPKIFNTDKNLYFEFYNRKDFQKAGLDMKFIQENQIFNHKGVLRGFHVNLNHPQGKLIRVLKGRIYDVVVDLRKGSKTYKKTFGVELSSENKKQLYIPEGMGHGYFACEESIVSLSVTTYYIPNDEVSFAWNSEELKINWPINGTKPIQNEGDSQSLDIKYLEI